MNSMIQQQQPHALVVVFDNLLTATQVAIALHDAGFSATDMEVITYGVDQEMPGDNRQDALETTGSSMLSAALKWGGVGLGAGATAGVVALAITSSPILGMGMIVVGGLTGAVMGGVAGIEHAVLNDSVDLPTAAEYRQLVLDGFNLVVLRGG
ncbi:MAG TPA: hypothetical protein PKD54_16250, partial [Pirellulaceae bacterium]|nr:hypothetical protein [Pirellulaceae bacterium]